MELKTKVKLKPFLRDIIVEEDILRSFRAIYESDLDAVAAVIKKQLLDELKERIIWDKQHLKSLGWGSQSVKGHVRSIMIIEEMENEKI